MNFNVHTGSNFNNTNNTNNTQLPSNNGSTQIYIAPEVPDQNDQFVPFDNFDNIPNVDDVPFDNDNDGLELPQLQPHQEGHEIPFHELGLPDDNEEDLFDNEENVTDNEEGAEQQTNDVTPTYVQAFYPVVVEPLGDIELQPYPAYQHAELSVMTPEDQEEIRQLDTIKNVRLCYGKIIFELKSGEHIVISTCALDFCSELYTDDSGYTHNTGRISDMNRDSDNSIRFFQCIDGRIFDECIGKTFVECTNTGNTHYLPQLGTPTSNSVYALHFSDGTTYNFLFCTEHDTTPFYIYRLNVCTARNLVKQRIVLNDHII